VAASALIIHTMKVLNLRCGNGHGFEGWFGSDDDFMDQNGRGLVECPLCGDSVVTRMPSAPRLNLSAGRQAEAAPADVQALWLQAVRHVLANTEDVGPRFAEEARRIHYGEIEARGIRGQTTPGEAQSLRDEGIEIASLPVPKAMKEPLQ
jgi:hypothetical protein